MADNLSLTVEIFSNPLEAVTRVTRDSTYRIKIISGKTPVGGNTTSLVSNHVTN